MPSIDPFNGNRHGAGSATRAALVTPDDVTDLAYVTLMVRATGAGSINVLMADQIAAVVLPFLAGETQRIRVRRVLNAGTTATGIVAYF